MTDQRPRPGGGVDMLVMRLAALVALAALVGIVPGEPGPTVAVPPTAPHASAGLATWTSPASLWPAALPRSVPVRVAIPAIKAASSLIPLRLNRDRTVQVPPLSKPMQAGWYSLGPTPGETGPGVILGHVDGYDRPGIFFRLRDVRPGDLILVTRRDGTTAQFVVQEREQVPKSQFPTEKVYGATERPELRLVTCGGKFDRKSGNYLDSIIVFAVLVASS